MKKSSSALQIGARDSRLSLIQTEAALHRLSKLFSAVQFNLISHSSPGDRDKKQDLRESPEDFFTRDLDNAVLAGELDGAVHSAKDLPATLREGLDWFWLDSPEDPRDVLVWRKGEARPDSGIVGVSSVRREAYCTGHFPGLEQRILRGTMEERLEQLDKGDIDLMVTAAAAMQPSGMERQNLRLYPAGRTLSPGGPGRPGSNVPQRGCPL